MKRASAMVLLLRVNVMDYGLELTRAYRKRAITALPEKPAIAIELGKGFAAAL